MRIKRIEERIESLEKELADHDIHITLIKDRIRDIEQTMKEKEERDSKAAVFLINKLRDLEAE